MLLCTGLLGVGLAVRTRMNRLGISYRVSWIGSSWRDTGTIMGTCLRSILGCTVGVILGRIGTWRIAPASSGCTGWFICPTLSSQLTASVAGS